MNIAPTEISPAAARRISIAAWLMAAFGTVAGQLHALARFHDHPHDLEYPLTRAWAVPAMDAVRPLLDWSDPTYVYWTYGKIWLPIFLTMTVAAWVVYRRRRPTDAERVAWRIQLGAYAVATISVAGDYYTVWTDVFFVIGMVPILVIGLVGGLYNLVRESLEAARDEAETREILRALRHSGGAIIEAAQALGISRTTMWEKMRRHSIEPASVS